MNSVVGTEFTVRVSEEGFAVDEVHVFVARSNCVVICGAYYLTSAGTRSKMWFSEKTANRGLRSGHHCIYRLSYA